MYSKNKIGTEALLCGLLTLLLLTPLASAQNDQTAAETLPLTESASREELMARVGQIQSEIDALPVAERSEESVRYSELRSELQRLLLRAELERLRIENETLKGLVDDVSAPESAAPPVTASMRRHLADMQVFEESLSRQLQVISEQHVQVLGPAAAAPPHADHPADMQTYTVEEGETLSSIAAQVYGTTDRWPEILEANPALTDPNRLEVGASLMIP